MSSKIALALLVVMTVTVVYAGHVHHDEGWGWSHPKYKYSYGVKDSHTHDEKHASEWRDGGNVGGHYALREPDGTWRTVTYWADKGGFRAKVDRSHHHHGWSG
ncbi:cuticle protein 19 [Folsomia candida]|uniref:Cuticle protein 8 n=1 Tax=Folsomia candida TaxID=158441 RepID=A0A226DY27_FOLCA|nr:cuticle protein 19 [Folsomia candida]OXA49938.1 Cuticle protein 8 [Folsomia candida]